MPLMLSLAAATGGVQCEARSDYEGPALYGAVRIAPESIDFQDGPAKPETAARFDEAFGIVHEKSGAATIAVAVAAPGHGLWEATDMGGEDVLAYWASAGKTFTAAVILQLVEEGKLSLDDRLSNWQPDLPNAGLITVRDLLQHSSGLYSANEDPDWRAEGHAGGAAAELELLRRHGALFCPGAYWRYSNSSYFLLGQIIEQVDGQPWREAIRARILAPLALEDSIVIDAGNDALVAQPLPADMPPTRTSVPGAAGPIAASPSDMIRFWAALLNGRIVSPITRDEMLARRYPMFDDGQYYGLGVMLFDVPDGQERLILLGHAGGLPGMSAFVAYSPATRTFVAVSVTGSEKAAATANCLLKAAADLPSDIPDGEKP